MDLNSKTVAPKKIWRLTYNARTNPPSRITATPRRCFSAPMERLKKTAILPRPTHRLDLDRLNRDQAPRPRPSAFRHPFSKKIFSLASLAHRYETRQTLRL
jgi:hypothetical protein